MQAMAEVWSRSRGSSSAAFCQTITFMPTTAKMVSMTDETITSHLPNLPIARSPIFAYDGTVSPSCAMVVYDMTMSEPVYAPYAVRSARSGSAAQPQHAKQ